MKYQPATLEGSVGGTQALDSSLRLTSIFAYWCAVFWSFEPDRTNTKLREICLSFKAFIMSIKTYSGEKSMIFIFRISFYMYR